MTRAVLSIGSNLGDRWQTLADAVRALQPWVRAVSPVYETAPWGPVPQGDYLNAVVLVEDPQAAPLDWLRRGQSAEQAAGRTRSIRFGPRTLDVDVITVVDGHDHGVQTEDAELTLPHPRAAERAFVLVPWLAVDAIADLTGAGSVHDLVAALPPEDVASVRRRFDLAPLYHPAGSTAEG